MGHMFMGLVCPADPDASGCSHADLSQRIISPQNTHTVKKPDKSSSVCTLLLRMSWKERVRLQERLGLRSESLTRAFSTHVWLRTVKRGVS